MQPSLKSGKYQLLCFLKISSAALCGFVPSIFLLVQIKLNTGETQTHTAMHEHTGKLLKIRGRTVYVKKASVIYCTQARLHPLHTHGKPLPNPLPLTSEQPSVWYAAPPTAFLIIGSQLQTWCLCSEPRGERSTSAYLTGGWLARCQNRKQIWKIGPVKASHSSAKHTHQRSHTYTQKEG